MVARYILVLRLKVSGASFFRTDAVEKDFIACIGPIEKSTSIEIKTRACYSETKSGID